MRGDKLHLAESIVISAVNHKYDRVCSRVVFFPQISHLCVRVRLSLFLSLSLARALVFAPHGTRISAGAHDHTRRTCSCPPRSHAVKVMLPRENVLACALVVGTNARTS